MKIIIASDSYKESLTSKQVGETIKRAFDKTLNTESVVIPIGDGGEGTVRALVDATEGTLVELDVLGPLREVTKAEYGLSGDKRTAFIEMATASGLNLVEYSKRNPFIATTYGTGQMIMDAIERGVNKIIIGIGGSATNDGGIGMASALGVRFLDESNKLIEPNNMGLESLHKIDYSQIDSRIKNVEVIVACDVNNPLTGVNGASYIYGPQKGADDNMVERMDLNLVSLANIIERDLGISVNDISGAGAAGGLGAGLVAFTNGTLMSGIDIVLDYLDFDNLINGADLVITGEGRFDYQTIMNKAPIGVARRAKLQNIKVIGISAVFGDGAESVLDNGIDAIFSVINKLASYSETVSNTEHNLYLTAMNIANILK